MAYDIIIGRDAGDKEKFEDKGLVYIGKGYVKMGNYTSLSNKIWMDIARNHVILISGKRGSGKSYTLAAIAEELSTLPQETADNIASIIFDTMGIFWTMKYENEKDSKLLEEWQLKPKKLPVKVFVPFGKVEEYRKKEIPFDSTFALKISELEAEDWITLFNLPLTSLPGVLIEKVISELKEQGEFTLNDIITNLEKEKASEETKEITSSLFRAADTWGIFSKSFEGTEVKDLLTPGATTILDTSVYSSIGAFNIRALVISLISRKIFKSRMDARKQEEIESIQHGENYLSFGKKKDPLVWMFIDECLTGDTEIITDKNHTPMFQIINQFESGEKVNVLGYDNEKGEFEHYPVRGVYRKGKRKIIEITTETGRRIKSTPEHRVLTRQGFASAFSAHEIATPIMQHYSQDQDAIRARLLGHLLGDGWAGEKTQSLGFAGKINPNDLNLIKKDLATLGLKSSNIYSRKTRSDIINSNNKHIKINGTSHSISASFNAYRYFEPLGIIKGDKVVQKSVVPEWIKNGSQNVKAEFLAALMGSDGNKISKAKNAKGDFNPIRFSFNKLESLEREAIKYANEIKSLFESLGVKISNIAKTPGNIRKNGDKTIKIVMTLEKNLSNTILFLEKVGYRYCKEKEKIGIKWSEYLKARIFLKKEREKIYEKCVTLFNEGKTIAQISKETGLITEIVSSWIKKINKPGLPKKFPDFDEWINNKSTGNLIYEKVFRIRELGEEDVYDISIDKVHNFVSNGLITHNCHEFLSKDEKTTAKDALIQLLREGRQPGISLVLATQQPAKLHADVFTQSDIVISHRVTSRPDIEALNNMMQTYSLEGIKQQFDNLPSLKGSAILLDDNSERIYPIRVRPRFTWHGGESPSAIKTDIKI